ncbi:unnamed protein product, partial [Polarella glacialis]
QQSPQGLARWARRWQQSVARERELRCPACHTGACRPELYGFPSRALLAHAAAGHCSFGSDQMHET